MNAKSSESGIVVATMRPLRMSYRKNMSTRSTSTIPRSRFSRTVWVVSAISSLRS